MYRELCQMWQTDKLRECELFEFIVSFGSMGLFVLLRVLHKLSVKVVNCATHVFKSRIILSSKVHAEERSHSF